MSTFEVLVQAVIQGLTEFLPVSSSGHLRLVQEMFGISPQEGTFLTVILHLGTLVAVFIAFWSTIKALIKEFFVMIGDIFRGRFHFKDMNPDRRMIVMLFISLVLLIPFYFFRHVFENISMPVLGVCFLFTSVELFFASRVRNNHKTEKDITAKDAVVIGLFQCVALFPGVSRSGSTISGGLFCGLEKETAVRYSFILGIPAILGGCISELGDALSGGVAINVPASILGFAVAAVVGVLAIALVRVLLRSDNFIVFSVYTFLISLVTFGYCIFAR